MKTTQKFSRSSQNVCNTVIPSGVCIGCGLCAGVCPPQVLEMRFNRFGEYIPVECGEGCLPKCDLCLRTCPFWNQADNEDTLALRAFGSEPNIKHKTETGYYLSAFAGYSLREGQRLNAASGGLATWFLQTLLEKGIVDRVISVAPCNERDRLFRFTIWDNPDDVQKSSKSCYYPVEMSEVIREVLNKEARYAVIGLPCFLKGIRLAMRTNRRLRHRIVVLAGLVCGQTKSKFFTEYLCALKGGNPRLMTRATFRIKSPERPANDYGFYFECSGGVVQSGTVFFLDGMRAPWSRGYFKPNACSYCDDVFAETADVVFMDAWLDRYISDSQGTNLVVVRKTSLVDLFEQGQREGSVYLEKVPIEDVLRSQQAVIDLKRSGLTERLVLAKRLHRKGIPNKRVNPTPLSPLRWCQLWLERWLISVSKEAFAKQRSRSGLSYFEWRVRPIWFSLKAVKRLRRFALRVGLQV